MDTLYVTANVTAATISTAPVTIALAATRDELHGMPYLQSEFQQPERHAYLHGSPQRLWGGILLDAE